MALKTVVKINHITNLSDARYCAGMGVALLGFSLENHSRYYVDPETFKELTSWVSGPEFIGEFDTYDPKMIASVMDKYQLDKIEITKPEMIQETTLLGKPVILKLNIDAYPATDAIMEDISYVNDMIDYVHLFSKQNRAVNTGMIKELCSKFEIIAGYGINKDNVMELIDQTIVKGIALDGQDETKVGFKDYDFLGDILEMIETDDPR